MWKTVCLNKDIPTNASMQDACDIPFIKEKAEMFSNSDISTKIKILAMSEKESRGWHGMTLTTPWMIGKSLVLDAAYVDTVDSTYFCILCGKLWIIFR